MCTALAVFFSLSLSGSVLVFEFEIKERMGFEKERRGLVFQRYGEIGMAWMRWNGLVEFCCWFGVEGGSDLRI